MYAVQTNRRTIGAAPVGVDAATLGQVAALYAFYFGVQTLAANWQSVVNYSNAVAQGTATLSSVELIFALYYVQTVMGGTEANVNTQVMVPDAIGLRLANLYMNSTGDHPLSDADYLAAVKRNFFNQALGFARNLILPYVATAVLKPVAPMPPLPITSEVQAVIASHTSSATASAATAAGGVSGFPVVKVALWVGGGWFVLKALKVL